ncbi:MAG: hypothetical protein ACTSPN_05265 [Promethearchaeota archaeon]
MIAQSQLNKIRSRDTPYDEFLCTKCRKYSNRYSNSAQVRGILLQNYIINLPISSNDGIGQ